MENICLTNRKFNFWFYHVSHCEALIRSPKDKNFDKNIDIYFGAIKYIEIPEIMYGLEFEEAKDEDVLYLCEKIGKAVSHEDIKVLISGGRRFYVVAPIIEIMENTLELMELPFYTFIKGTDSLSL